MKLTKFAIYKFRYIFMLLKEGRTRDAQVIFLQMARRPLLELKAILGLGSFPDFLIIGAEKCGTTWLYDVLTKHPQILPSYKKEVGFFGKHIVEKPLNWYRAFFPILRRKGNISGEVTPNYLFHPLVPRRVKRVLSNAKFIVLLRNPVDRAYSRYQMLVHRRGRKAGREPLSFEDAIVKEEERLKDAWPRILAGSRHSAFSYHAYKARGRYAEQLQRWFALFPRDQFLILRTKDLRTDPQKYLRQVFAFLGVDPNAKIDLGSVLEATRPNKYEPMDPHTRQQLTDYFRPYNKELYRMLGRDFEWEASTENTLDQQ